MSFFYDFLKYFDIENLDAKTTISFIVGYGVIVMGKIKIKDISDGMVRILSNKDVFKIIGENLNIKSISKGELVISGKVKNIEME